MQIPTAVVSLAPRLGKPWAIARGLPIALAIIALAGCNALQNRHGPPPIVQAAEVEAASGNKLRLLRALAQDASIGGDRASDWYLIAEAGFNFVDDQCRAYFDELFFLDRRADRIKTGLVVADKTTAAILAVTGATVPTMNIVAQAFGFAVHATDLIAGTYLYRLPPATTQGFVTKLQLRFRQEAAMARGSVNSPTLAYYLIQRYLDLCLPPRIEAEIAKQISGTTAVGVPGGPGAEALFSLETFSTPPVATVNPPVMGPGPGPGRVLGPGSRSDIVVKERIKTKLGLNSKEQIKVTPPPAGALITGGITDIEKSLSLERGKAIQRVLCVPDSGNFNMPTRVALQLFNSADPRATQNGAIRTDLDMDRLLAALGTFSSCEKAGLRNAFEVGILQHLGADIVRRNLAAGLKAQGLPVPEQLTAAASAPVDNVVRRAVRDLRKSFGMSDLDDMDKQFYDKLTSTIQR